jgi:hypothetical protein
VRKRIATLVAGLGIAGVLVPLGGTAQASDCVGSSAFPATFACVIRRQLVGATVTPGPVLHTPPFCAEVCLGEQAIQLLDINIDDHEITVVYYAGKCYYVGNGTITTRDATSIDPPACP